MSKLCLPFLALALVGAVPAPAQPAVSVKTEAVQIRTLHEDLQAYGQVAPDPRAFEWISAAQSGRIDAVLVTPGERVARGAGLVRIAPTPDTLAAWQSAKAAVAAASAKLKQAQTLAAGGLATQADVSAAQSAYSSAQAQLAALQAAGVGSTPELVTAAKAGVVTQLAVGSGDWVTPGAHVAALAPADALWVRLGLPPEEAGQVHTGDVVSLSPVFGAGAATAAKVAAVAAQADAATGLVDVEVPLPARAGRMLTGEWVSGQITVRTAKLPAVARSAVLRDEEGYYVFVVDHGTAKRVTVEPLIRDSGYVGLKGVTAGERVVVQGNFELSGGEPVREAGR